MISLCLLLCIAREKAEAEATDGMGSRAPSFAAIPVAEGERMSPDQVSQLKLKSSAALQLASKFSNLCPWAGCYITLIRAMIAYGLGGSPETAISALAAAAVSAAKDGVIFCKDLAHLYCGIMMHKAGRDRAVVDAELLLATQGECPNFASNRAHELLGTKDRRHLERPKVIFDDKQTVEAFKTD